MLELRAKVVTGDAVELGLTVSLQVDDREYGLYEVARVLSGHTPLGGPYPEPDLRAVLADDRVGVLSVIALTPDGEAFVELIRSGDLR